MFGQPANITVDMFILTQTGTYQEQSLRPFNTTVTPGALNALSESTRGGTQFNVASVQNVAGDILSPSATVEAPAQISNGWRSRRFRFLMKVTEVAPFQERGYTQRIFFGYTDQCDVSFNQTLDPQMRIYFNSETVVETNYSLDMHGNMVPVARVVASNQIVSPMDMSGNSGFINGVMHRPTSYLVRPDDVFSQGQNEAMLGKLRESGRIDASNIHYDERTMLGQGGPYKYSRRNDASPVRYMAHTLKAYSSAVHEAREEQGTADADYIYETALGTAANQSIHTNGFFARLKDQTGYMENGFVEYRELLAMQPELNDPQRMIVAMDDGTSIRKTSQAEDSNYWHGSSRTDIAASMIAQVVPAIMMDNMFRTLTFSATNGMMGVGSYAIDFNSMASASIVENLNMIDYFQSVEHRLEYDVLASITHRNQISFQLSVHADLAGETIIDISLEGEPMVRYVAPTFTDSLFSPVVTSDKGRADTIANDMRYLMETVVPTVNPHMGVIQEPNMNAQPQPVNTQLNTVGGNSHVQGFSTSGLL